MTERKRLKRVRALKKKRTNMNRLKGLVKYRNSPKRYVEKLRAEGKIIQSNNYTHGAVAQLGEHLTCTEGVAGSSPVSSTYVVVTEEIGGGLQTRLCECESHPRLNKKIANKLMFRCKMIQLLIRIKGYESSITKLQCIFKPQKRFGRQRV